MQADLKVRQPTYLGGDRECKTSLKVKAMEKKANDPESSAESSPPMGDFQIQCAFSPTKLLQRVDSTYV